MTDNSLNNTNNHWLVCAPTSVLQDKRRATALANEWLSFEERGKADRFHRREDRLCYMLAHMLKRYYLSSVLGVKPDALIFTTGDNGKPFCQNEGAPYFNISHTNGRVLFGMSSVDEIGVDIEPSERNVGDSTAAYVLTSAEMDHVKQASNSRLTFMCYWTQKEAISKALGLGLSIDFKTVHCSGELGSSSTQHSNRQLNVNSQMIEEGYIISTACTSSQPMSLYQLDNWSTSVPVTKNMGCI